MSRLGRRRFLRGLLGGAVVGVSLPLLDVFLDDRGRAFAGGGALPRRFGLYFWGNGVLPERWVPKAEGFGWTPSDQLAPLADLTERVSVVSGFSVKTPNDVPHGSGAGGLLTGAALTDLGKSNTFALPSIDQVIAAKIGGETPYRSLQTAATDTLGLSYNGPNSVNPAETSPYALFERLFGPSFREPGEDAPVDPTLALRRSVLDAVADDVSALEARVGAADRARLDQHLTGIRELELRLAALAEDPGGFAACERPEAPLEDYPDVDGRPQVQARHEAMLDLLVMALACDQTRVFAHFLSEPVSDVLFPGASAGHHDLTHNEPDPQPEVHAITVQCVEAFATLVRKLDALSEGDATLLDRCAIVGATEVSYGRTHSLDDMPLLLAGGADGRLLPGQHVRSYTRDNASKFMLTVARAVGADLDSFGADEGLVSEGLSELEA